MNNFIFKICYIVVDFVGVRGGRGFCWSVFGVLFGVCFVLNDIVGLYGRLRVGSIGVRGIG